MVYGIESAVRAAAPDPPRPSPTCSEPEKPTYWAIQSPDWTFRNDTAQGMIAAVDERAALKQARSMLILLLATCQQTQTALGAAANALDTDLTSDLGAMIERTEAELAALTDKIEALPD